MAVLVDLEVAVTFHEDIILSIDGNHWHLAQHVEHGLCLRLVICLHIVTDTVDLLLDELALGLDLYVFQFLVPGDGVAFHAR